MVFCTEPYEHHREYIQTLCTLSVLNILHIFCARARFFFSSDGDGAEFERLDGARRLGNALCALPAGIRLYRLVSTMVIWVGPGSGLIAHIAIWLPLSSLTPSPQGNRLLPILCHGRVPCVADTALTIQTGTSDP